MGLVARTRRSQQRTVTARTHTSSVVWGLTIEIRGVDMRIQGSDGPRVSTSQPLSVSTTGTKTVPETVAPSGKRWQTRELASCPPPERWHDWTELDAKAWP